MQLEWVRTTSKMKKFFSGDILLAVISLLFHASTMQTTCAFQPVMHRCQDPVQRTALIKTGKRTRPNKTFCSGDADAENETSSGLTPTKTRRSFFSHSCGRLSAPLVASWLLGASSPPAARAGIDPSALKALPVEGDATGAATRLKQLSQEKDDPNDLVDIPFEELPSGVSYREYRKGKGEAVVQPGSKVGVEMTIRCKSFATANEPGGLKYFTTKEDTEFNELAFTVGSGEILPGLEEGMMGMRRGAVRRIQVPSTMVFAAKKADQLPLPGEKNKDGNRRFGSLFKTDATLLFEVLVTRIK